MISLIHPSRGRADKAAQTLANWAIRTTNSNVEHILSIDSSDPQKGEYYDLANNREFDKVIENDNHSVVEAANHAAKEARGDILIYLSDDFDCPINWSKLILDKIAGKEKVMLHVNDGLQPMSNAVLTIPIMTRALYKELGYFFYHEYKSMWCDVDLYWSTKKYMIHAPELLFEHKHHSRGHCENDETYRRSEGNWHQGLEIYNRRAKQFGWPLKSR